MRIDQNMIGLGLEKVNCCNLSSGLSLLFLQEDPHLQSSLGLPEWRLRGGGRSREGPQRLPPPPQHRNLPDQAARGEHAGTAGGHYEGGGELGRPAGQQCHLQWGLLESRAPLWQHSGEAERKCLQVQVPVMSSTVCLCSQLVLQLRLIDILQVWVISTVCQKIRNTSEGNQTLLQDERTWKDGCCFLFFCFYFFFCSAWDLLSCSCPFCLSSCPVFYLFYFAGNKWVALCLGGCVSMVTRQCVCQPTGLWGWQAFGLCGAFEHPHFVFIHLFCDSKSASRGPWVTHWCLGRWWDLEKITGSCF